MKCFNIVLSGYDVCEIEPNGRYQQVVFIRKDDLLSYEIESKLDYTYSDLEPIPYHNIKFKLKDNTKGIRFQLNENSTIIEASFSKSNNNNLPRYNHKVSIGIYGVTENRKWILKQFDLSKDYFAVLQHKSNVVEVFGFHNGFKTETYDYNDSITLDLVSSFDEYDLPYIYKSEVLGNEIIDFDNDFANMPITGNDFNIDYNNDYN